MECDGVLIGCGRNSVEFEQIHYPPSKGSMMVTISPSLSGVLRSVTERNTFSLINIRRGIIVPVKGSLI